MEHEVDPARAQRVHAQRGQHSAGSALMAHIGMAGPGPRHVPVDAPDGIGVEAVLDAGLGHRAGTGR